jgi:hypothetical protein
VAQVEHLINFAHFFRVAQPDVARLQQLRLRNRCLGHHVLESESDTHRLEKQALRHRWMCDHVLVHLGDGLNLREVDVGSEVQSTHHANNLVPVLDQLVFFDASERVTERMVFPIVYYQACAPAQLYQATDILSEFVGARTNFKHIALLKVLLGLLREQLLLL